MNVLDRIVGRLVGFQSSLALLLVLGMKRENDSARKEEGREEVSIVNRRDIVEKGGRRGGRGRVVEGRSDSLDVLDEALLESCSDVVELLLEQSEISLAVSMKRNDELCQGLVVDGCTRTREEGEGVSPGERENAKREAYL